MRSSRPNPKRYSLDVEHYKNSRTSPAADTSTLFHSALKKMDGVIGYGSSEVSTFGHDSSSLSKIATLCEDLKNQLLATHQNGMDPRLDIPTETRDTLVTWLLGDPRGSPFTSQLQKDRETLIQQVQVLERKLEVSQSENESLKTSLIEMQKKVTVSCSDLTTAGHTRTYSAGALQFQEEQITRNQTVTSMESTSGSLPHHYNRTTSSSSVKAGNENLKRNRSFRESFRRAFNRKKSNGKDLGQEDDNSHKPLNSRTQHFHSLNGPDLADWMNSIGLEMYGELISQLVGTGERLASICSNTEDLMRLGVLNVLHCKKLRLAVEDAIAEVPGPLSKLDHRWVADWLKDVGLPQYQQPFMDARIDGQMLNCLSLEDLEFLKINHPFHIISLKRAIQAFRMCGFDPNYLKVKQEKGGYKLFHWSVYHIMDWMKDIELDEYAPALQGTGINGPVVALESSLTHQSIAKAVGIAPSKALIVTHLGEKFVSIIGPIFAQRKVDTMNHKNFVPLDITPDLGKGKSRSKSLTKKSSKQGQHREETFLCPPNEVLPMIPKTNSRYSMVQLTKNGSLRGMGTTNSTKSVTDAWCNSTVSSGNNPGLGYSPSPPLPTVNSNSPPAVVNNTTSNGGMSSSVINLEHTPSAVSMATTLAASSQQQLNGVQSPPALPSLVSPPPNGVPAPPPPPPAPPVIKAY